MKAYLELFSNICGASNHIVRNAFHEEKNDGGCKESLPQIFEHDGNRIRVKMVDGNPWFCGVDVARALEYQKPANAVTSLCKEEGVTVLMTPTKNQWGSTVYQKMKFINEGNLYRLIMRSRAKKAEVFSDWVTDTVLPSIRKTGGYNAKQELPDFIRRLRLNYNHVPKTHFSVLNELYQRLYLQFERVGHILPDISELGKMLMPDISVGKCFAKHMKELGYDWKNCIRYKHHFADGRVVDAYAYPNEMLPAFISFVNEKWLPLKAYDYLKDKDPKALEYLPKLLTDK